MVKIKISYTDRKELQKLMQVLYPYTLKIEKSNNKKGIYKKAYATLEI